MFFNTTRKKHRNLQGFWWVGGDPEVSPLGSAAGAARHYNLRLPTEGLRQGHGSPWQWPAPGFKGYCPCRRPLSKQVVKMRGAAQAPATLNKRSVTLHKRVCNAEQACVQRWTSVLERCTSVFATLHKRFGTLHKRVCNAEQATYKVGLANTEGATHKWSHMVSCRPNTL